MSDRRPCIRCGRTIDAVARICPYCNWDQTEAVPAAIPVDPTVAAAPPPPTADEAIWKRRILLAVAFVALVIASFSIGALLHHRDPKTEAATTNETRGQMPPAPEAHAPNGTTFVPVSGNAPADVPVTSAPAATASNGAPAGDRSDATALPSDQYAAIAARAKAEQQAVIDPRTIRGDVFSGGNANTQRPQPQRSEQVTVPMASSSAEPPRVARRTPPVPEYQPVPNIRVDTTTTARLNLTVGADGRVKDVEISEAIPGQTPKLIAAVQNWRFRPATENGVPVEARFSVDISFHGNE